jgi:hypothetical protein
MCGAGTHPGGGVTGAPGHNRIGIATRCRNRQTVNRLESHICFKPADAGIGPIMNFGKAVGSQKGKLEFFPFLLIQGCVKAQCPIQQCSLEPDLIVGEIVRRIGRDG